MNTLLNRGILFLFAVVSLLGVPMITNAQGTDQSISNLGDVVIRFCNENGQGEKGKMNDLFFEADTETPYDLCMLINNNGPTDVNVILNFMDGTVTADDGQNKACQPEGTKTNFGKYVDYISQPILVKAGTTTETHGEIEFPDGFSGMSYGCVSLKFVDDDNNGGGEKMFNVLARRGYFIDVLVGGEINLGLTINDQTDLPFKNLTSSNQLTVYKEDTGLYKARISVTNPGNIAQEVTVVPTVQGLFTEPKSGKNLISQSIVNDTIVDNYSMQWDNNPEALPSTKKVLPNQSVAFDFELNDALPLWKGPIDLSVELTHKPIFEFVSAEISPKLLAKKSIILGSSFFIMPWLVIGLIIALLLIGVITTGKKEEQRRAKKKASPKKKVTKK